MPRVSPPGTPCAAVSACAAIAAGWRPHTGTTPTPSASCGHVAPDDRQRGERVERARRVLGEPVGVDARVGGLAARARPSSRDVARCATNLLPLMPIFTGRRS